MAEECDCDFDPHIPSCVAIGSINWNYIIHNTHTGHARSSVTLHKRHTRVCCAKLTDIRAYTAARLSDICMVADTWYQVLGSKVLVPSTLVLSTW